ncbi:hypothetical protein B0H13DRAFT_1894717 [Mycena leptocephala]|nr:hypothetical protein B0H13DRAFT_1894717 [Mycena leptocephala]
MPKSKASKNGAEEMHRLQEELRRKDAKIAALEREKAAALAAKKPINLIPRPKGQAGRSSGYNLSSSDPRHFVTSLRSEKVREFDGKARNFVISTKFWESSSPRFNSDESSSLGWPRVPASPVMEAQDAANNTQTGIEMGLIKSFMQEFENFCGCTAHLKLKRAESKGNSSGRVRAPRFQKSHATELDANGTKDCHRKSSTQAPSNVSTSASAGDVTVADKTIRDAPLNLGPLKGWGIEKDGISMSAVEYAQNVWNINDQ